MKDNGSFHEMSFVRGGYNGFPETSIEAFWHD